MRISIIILSFFVSSYVVAGEANELASPEATLAGYIKCFETANVNCVLNHYHGINNFYIKEPHKIEYKVIKKIVYSFKEVDSWNSKGIVPASELGDVELQVEEDFLGYKGMWSYNFRNINGKWYIISHSAWGVD